MILPERCRPTATARVVVAGLVVRLLDAGEHEDLVVHRQPEREHEDHDGHHEVERTRRSQSRAPRRSGRPGTPTPARRTSRRARGRSSRSPSAAGRTDPVIRNSRTNVVTTTMPSASGSRDDDRVSGSRRSPRGRRPPAIPERRVEVPDLTDESLRVRSVRDSPSADTSTTVHAIARASRPPPRHGPRRARVDVVHEGVQRRPRRRPTSVTTTIGSCGDAAEPRIDRLRDLPRLGRLGQGPHVEVVEAGVEERRREEHEHEAHGDDHQPGAAGDEPGQPGERAVVGCGRRRRASR